MTRDTGDRVWKFYGLFQLTSGLTCSDDTAQLPNICGANCTGESGTAGFFPLYFQINFSLFFIFVELRKFHVIMPARKYRLS